MPIQFDSFIDTLLARFISPRQEPPLVAESRSSARTGPLHSSGHFRDAHHFVLNQPQFAENMFVAGNTVLERLNPYTMPGAAMDSSARHPPPKCHPETRLQIRQRLEHWMDDHDRQQNMMWLFGFAGTGKSAVAQTFAESCAEKHRHGASYFFSRPGKRNKTETVIPTLTYQLAVNCDEYKSILTSQFANDLQLLDKAPDVQLRKLIVEPFARLQNKIQKPLVIILDALDECEEDDTKREKAQCGLVKMISEVVRTKQGLPLIWLICSRPEAHLKHLFSRIPECGREELRIDAETRDDVERYLQDEFGRIKAEDIVLASLPLWPSEEQLREILRAVSGLIRFRIHDVKYIDSSVDANPAKGMESVVSYLKDAKEIGSTDPLVGLDLLYMRILGDIPDNTFPVTWRILAYMVYVPQFYGIESMTSQALCNFLDLDQQTFYGALRKVYSVVDVPGPENAAEARLRFYHASFQDFLLNPNRSGNFSIAKEPAMADIAKSGLSWHMIDLTLFHTHDGPKFDRDHNHDSLPGLKWSSANTQAAISKKVAQIAAYSYGWPFWYLSGTEKHEALLSQVYSFDFQYIYPTLDLCDMANWILRQDPSSLFVRTKPSSEVDFRLLKYMKAVTNEDRVKAVTFSVFWGRGLKPGYCRYFFMGQGEKSAIFWFMKGLEDEDLWRLNADKEPSEQVLSDFRDWLQRIEWSGYDTEANMDDGAESDTEDEGGRILRVEKQPN